MTYNVLKPYRKKNERDICLWLKREELCLCNFIQSTIDFIIANVYGHMMCIYTYMIPNCQKRLNKEQFRNSETVF